MHEFTIEDLKRIVREGAGEDAAALDGDVLDRSFQDLGYDSLAVLETVSRVSREVGVALPDELVTEADTPGRMVQLVNDAMALVSPAP